MRKLNRTVVEAPQCLESFQHGRDNWSDVGGPCKEEIRDQLEKLQGRLCAYCEGDLNSLGQHVEHFWRKGLHPKRTFDWNNLFASCNRTDSCGHFKDRGAGSYHPADLVNPCLEEPDLFFRFRADGSIDPRPGLTSRDRDRARETLRVFNLNLDHGRSLVAERRRTLEFYKDREPDVLGEIESWPAGARAAFIQGEFTATSTEPFGTVIRHFFSG